ncbi:MAG: ribosome recycling factor [Anaerolineaceae bacterium]|jgi:ribosome recycling factor|nr:ribosome recycling factor [Anaerolineaceae bacterium]HNX45101.1 ribosome recycling factor [Anaerolineaceae bacterium]HPT23850.1 ribosome recycling factor [Anaerolineaceae bacterium]
MIDDLYKDSHERMETALSVLEEDLMGIRTGRASPALVEKLLVEYYGSDLPLIQLASISVPEPRQLMIRPFDASSLKAIEKAILASELGLTPSNDGKVVRLNLPPLTEERRRDLARMVSRRLEECRVAIRNIRRDTMKDLKELEKEKLISEDDLNLAEDKLTTLTEKMVERVGEIGTRKEREIMEF